MAPHFNPGDVSDGWVARFCMGDFERGDLVLPGLGIKLPYQPGDLVFLKSAKVDHYINEYDSSGTGLVMSTKKTTCSKLHDELLARLDLDDPLMQVIQEEFLNAWGIKEKEAGKDLVEKGEVTERQRERGDDKDK